MPTDTRPRWTRRRQTSSSSSPGRPSRSWRTATSTGVKVILFLIVLTALLYAYKRKVWAKVH